MTLSERDTDPDTGPPCGPDSTARGERPLRYWLDAYFARNFGDDLMVRSLAEHHPSIEFIGATFELGTGVGAPPLANVRPPSRLGLVECLTSKGYVIVGGSMFMDRAGRTLKAYLRHRRLYVTRATIAAAMRLLGRPVHIVGCNIGPIDTRMGKIIFRTIFALSNSITVRDRASSDWLETFGIHSILAPDMVYGWVDRFRNSYSEQATNTVLGVSVYPHAALQQPARYLNWMRNLITDSLARGYDRVRLLCFSEREGDTETANLLTVAFTGDPRIEIVTYGGDVDAFATAIAQCAALVAGRFHAVVIGRALGLPLVVTSYSPKIVRHLEDEGQTGLVYDAHRMPPFDAERVFSELARNCSCAVLKLRGDPLDHAASLSGRYGRQSGQDSQC